MDLPEQSKKTERDKNIGFLGFPTGPQVRKLEAAFPEIEKLRGTIIPHEQIEEIVDEKRGTSRYKTVINAWRRKTRRESGVYIVGTGDAVGKGFKVLRHDEQVEYSGDRQKRAGRRIREGIHAAMNVDTKQLSPEKSKFRDHLVFGLGRIRAAILEARDKPIAPKEIEAAPQRKAAVH